MVFQPRKKSYLRSKYRWDYSYLRLKDGYYYAKGILKTKRSVYTKSIII